MTTAEQIAGLTELENLVTQLEAWEGMISAGYQCPAAGISMINAAKHLADIAHKLRTGQLIVVDHPQATSPVDEPINATDAAFMAGEAIYQRDGVSPFLREVMQLKRDNEAKPVDDRGGAVCEQQAVEAVANAIREHQAANRIWRMKDLAHAAIAAMPSLTAKDVEIADLKDRLADAMLYTPDSYVYGPDALGDEA